MRKIKILHVIDTLGVGGAERVLIGEINGLPEFEHHIFYLNTPNTLVEELPSDCKLYTPKFRSSFDIIRCVFLLKKYIRQNEIDIVHSQLLLSNVIARLAVPRKLKFFASLQNIYSIRYFSSWKAKLMVKLTYRGREHIIAVSEEVRRDFDKSIGLKGPCSIIYNYAEDKFFASSYKRKNSNGMLSLVAVGNLKKQKNYEYLIEAFKKLPSCVQLDIYGDGELKEELQLLIDKYKLNIRLCGVRNDMYDVLKEYDVFIMSSWFEGLPVALVEAMACGLPTVLSDIPVLREVTDNKSIFFELSDSDNLVKKINMILDQEINLDEYAKASFERAKLIATKENFLNTLRNLYNSSGNAR